MEPLLAEYADHNNAQCNCQTCEPKSVDPHRSQTDIEGGWGEAAHTRIMGFVKQSSKLEPSEHDCWTFLKPLI
jgi:hypothetical protein